MRTVFGILSFLVFAACASAPLEAQTPAPARQATMPAGPSGRYVIDAAHTQVAFSIDRFGFNHVLGRFDAVAGEISLDVAAPERSSVSATIQTASVSSGDATRDEHLRGARWLDAAQYPTMTFRSTAVRRTGERTAEMRGDLTLHGATHPVTLTVTLNQMAPLPNNQRPGAGFSATGVISRTQFGMTAAEHLIGDDVRITIEALGELPEN